MQASDILDLVRRALNDVDSITWSDGDLLAYLSAAQRAVILARPDAYAKVAAVKLVVGTRQALPADGLRLLDVVRNMGSDGTTPGKPIRLVERRTLDAVDPSWHSRTGKTKVMEFCHDDRDRTGFFVTPPVGSASDVYVELLYSQVPADLTVAGDALVVPAVYAEALRAWAMYEAFSTETDSVGSATSAQQQLALFQSLLGIKTKADQTFTPARELRNSNEGVV